VHFVPKRPVDAAQFYFISEREFVGDYCLQNFAKVHCVVFWFRLYLADFLQIDLDRGPVSGQAANCCGVAAADEFRGITMEEPISALPGENRRIRRRSHQG
jgi:hypothetical protein